MLKAWTRIDVDKEDSLCTVSTSHKDNSASARGLTPAASSRPSTSTSTSQSSSARQTLPSPLPRRQPVPSCNTCLNPIRGSLPIKPNCSHTFCDPCAREHFTRATTNESLYPPSCCGKPIPFVRVFHCLTSSERTRFRRAQLEFASTDRTYCSNLCCGVFIQSGKELAVCPFCKSRSCGHCKRAEHPDIDCPEDTQLQKVLRLAERKGWKRCPRCRTMVEMRSGCYHITCKCSAEWCYLCSAPWKTCACSQWQEANLLTPRVVDRRIVRNSRVDPDGCQHSRKWWREQGRNSYTCAFCGETMYWYILSCRGTNCGILACRDCRGYFPLRL
ncbi:hypothetical protein EX30DRAFT_312524 [Ascodesmis nigricans]|uniref:RING-type domain-containing protein n=1 Tax=Ascodesmis nigricans TaxID=341454 RepID=A0A4S2MHP4_9PEZI|nr:hypothetical protein EX30DRAFT_312524 [Ascodesmis nigricans]